MEILCYVHDHNIYCPDCAPHPAQSRIADLEDVATPVFASSGAEFDAPVECNECGDFLENPLTPHGVTFLIEQLRNFDADRANPEPLTTWAAYYADEIERHDDVDLFLRDDFSAHSIVHFAAFDDDDERLMQLLRDLRDCARPGDAHPAVRYVIENYRVVASPDIRRQLQRDGYDPDDLADHTSNVERMIWSIGAEIHNDPESFDLGE